MSAPITYVEYVSRFRVPAAFPHRGRALARFFKRLGRAYGISHLGTVEVVPGDPQTPASAPADPEGKPPPAGPSGAMSDAPGAG